MKSETLTLLQTIFVLAIIGVYPICFNGIIIKTKALWAGRQGQKIFQLYFDLLRLLRKEPKLSNSATSIIWMGPYVVLAGTLVAGFMSPIIPGFSLISFDGDFIFFVYLWALTRFAIIISAMDTGSAFEGMGSAREALFSAFIEPAYIFAFGLLASNSSSLSLVQILGAENLSTLPLFIRCLLALTIYFWLLIENSRVPADDPNTHLELTMIHEVMILDHSGPDLAAYQLAANMKMLVFTSLLSCVLVPAAWAHSTALMVLWAFGFQILVPILIGTTESIMARLPMKHVPLFALFSVSLALSALALFYGRNLQ